MPDKEHEFINPMAPPGAVQDTPHSSSQEFQRLTNDDFRKLIMTPRVPSSSGVSGSGSAATPLPSSASASHHHHPSSSSSGAAGTVYNHHHREPLSERDEEGKPGEEGDEESRGERRRKKKMFYARMKREEEDTLAQLALKYRDRAKERRDGGPTGVPGASEEPSAQGAYRAVAPDIKSGMDAAERRRRAIQESKFLGGDMEHTHLVKGLDYALLQKVSPAFEGLQDL